MRTLLFFVCLLTTACFTTMQAQRFQWYTTGGYASITNSFHGAVDIEQDSLGNTVFFDYVNGRFEIQGDTVASASGQYSTIVVRTSKNGTLLNQFVIGLDFDVVAVEVAANSDMYFLGYSRAGTLLIDNQSQPIKPFAMHILKVNALGQLIWVKEINARADLRSRMLLLHNNHLYAQTSTSQISKFDTLGNVVASLGARYYKSYTAHTEIIFRAAGVFSNGDVAFAGLTYGDVAFTTDTLFASRNTALELPLLVVRATQNMELVWAKYVADGLRFPDCYSLPFVVANDDIYAGIEVVSTTTVADSIIDNTNGDTYLSALACFDQNGEGKWARTLSPNLLPYALQQRHRSGAVLTGSVVRALDLDGIEIRPTGTQSVVLFYNPDGSLANAQLPVKGNYGSIAQDVELLDDNRYLLSGLLNGGDGVPIFSCDTSRKISGLYAGSIIEEPDTPPIPAITQRNDTLFASPSFLGEIQWFLNGAEIVGGTLPHQKILTAGTYSVRFSYVDGCVSLANSEPTIISTSSVYNLENNELRAWPNPTTDALMFSHSDLIQRIDLVDIRGLHVRSWSNTPIGPIALGGLTPGTYSAHVFTSNGLFIVPIVKL